MTGHSISPLSCLSLLEIDSIDCVNRPGEKDKSRYVHKNELLESFRMPEVDILLTDLNEEEVVKNLCQSLTQGNNFFLSLSLFDESINV